MNTGIQDAYNLAWKMALVLQGGADEKLLETYNEERLENAKHLLKTTDRMFQFAAGSEWFLAFLRTNVLPPVAKYILGFDAVKKFVFPLILYPRVAEVFGANNSFNVLLRPDNHIGFISTESPLSGLRAYLNEFVGYS